MAKQTLPMFHQSLLKQDVYPSTPKRIKFEESPRSYFYWTGEHVYRIRKSSVVYSNLAIQEAFAHEALRLGHVWAPGVVEAVVPVIRCGEGYALGTGDDAGGEPVAYALRQKQLTGQHWLSDLVRQEKLTPLVLGKLAQALADWHAAQPAPEQAAEVGRAEHLRGLIEEASYQTKKYIGHTITEAMYETMVHPIEHFLDEERKLFLRRIKKDRIVAGHGAFIPEHIYLKGKEVFAISPLEAQPKYRILDVANDVATLCNALNLHGAAESAELFLKRYISHTRDRGLERMLPIYGAFQALRNGVLLSERMVEQAAAAPLQAQLASEAQASFNLAVQRVREILRTA